MHRGKLSVWKDEQGFGFIKPDHQGKDVFLHISALKNINRRPQVGDVICYQTEVDKKGKIRACNAYIEEALSQYASQSLYLALKILLLSVFPVWGSVKLALVIANPLPLLVYPVMGVITFLSYADDKTRAQKGRWRIPERTLHICELAGGWIGAFIAQQRLRHKSSKSSYQLVFWVIVTIHLVFWVDWLLLSGTLINFILNKFSK